MGPALTLAVALLVLLIALASAFLIFHGCSGPCFANVFFMLVLQCMLENA